MNYKVEDQICSFGCGKPAIKQFKNGKFCCSNTTNGCPAVQSRIVKSTSNVTKSNKAIPFENPDNIKCSFGCDNIARFQYKTGTACCCDNWHRCPGQKENLSERTKKIMNNPEVKAKVLKTRAGKDLTPHATLIDTNEKCQYGCGEQAHYVFNNGKYCCSDRVERCSYQKKKISERLIKQWEDPEYAKKVTSWERTEEYKQKVSDATSGVPKTYTADSYERLVNACKRSLDERVGKERSDQIKEKLRQYRLGKSWKSLFGDILAKYYVEKVKETFKNNNHVTSNETKQLMSIKKKEQWEDPNSSYNSINFRIEKSKMTKSYYLRPDYVEKKRDQFVNNNSPNKEEIIVLNLLHELGFMYTFVGDGSLWINGRNPDFVLDNKIIEYFGSYWHSENMTGLSKEDHEYDRRHQFELMGYECLIIWDYELKNLENLKQKIIEYSESSYHTKISSKRLL